MSLRKHGEKQCSLLRTVWITLVLFNYNDAVAVEFQEAGQFLAAATLAQAASARRLGQRPAQGQVSQVAATPDWKGWKRWWQGAGERSSGEDSCPECSAGSLLTTATGTCGAIGSKGCWIHGHRELQQHRILHYRCCWPCLLKAGRICLPKFENLSIHMPQQTTRRIPRVCTSWWLRKVLPAASWQPLVLPDRTTLKEWCGYVEGLCKLWEQHVEEKAKTLDSFADSERQWEKQLRDATQQLARLAGDAPADGGNGDTAIDVDAEEEQEAAVDEAARQDAKQHLILQRLSETEQRISEGAARSQPVSCPATCRADHRARKISTASHYNDGASEQNCGRGEESNRGGGEVAPSQSPTMGRKGPVGRTPLFHFGERPPRHSVCQEDCYTCPRLAQICGLRTSFEVRLEQLGLVCLWVTDKRQHFLCHDAHLQPDGWHQPPHVFRTGLEMRTETSFWCGPDTTLQARIVSTCSSAPPAHGSQF